MDADLLEEVLDHIHNWFLRDLVQDGEIKVEDGQLPASISSKLLEGQWYRIEGSLLNDGLHQHPDEDLTDEEFEGRITSLAIPKGLLAAVEDIAAWQEANAEALRSPYASESFGGYSYTLKGETRAQESSGGLTGWRAAFADRLNAWRKIA